MFGFSNIFKSKPFDFIEYLDEMEFVLKHDLPDVKIYQKNLVLIYVYEPTEENKNQRINICVLDFPAASFSFIPKSRTMLDILLNQIRIDIIENDELKINEVE